MAFDQQVAMVAASSFLLFGVIYLVAHNRLQLRHSLLWLVLGVGVFVTALFPEPMFACARFFRFEYASNFLFVVGILYLLTVVLSLSSIVSRQHDALKNTVQHIALLEHDLNELREELGKKQD